MSTEGIKFTVIANTYQLPEGGQLMKGQSFTRPIGDKSISLLCQDRSLKNEPVSFVNNLQKSGSIEPSDDIDSEFADDVALVDCEGIEASFVEKLADVEIITAKQVLEADDEVLTTPSGIGKATAKLIKEACEQALIEANL